ncbi:GH1 family beta-glucosidase [Agromyces mariniharenae]|uniref:Beta-glucosidase n=1 Tax=Agromyces mariniharenae TaxID=2604423 RepID=A0A5S4V954_9MICO|nr:GH1 family beta-glucosidase [Agromyces mariniharenae]TYL53110.1 beta-glucosidase [Agromyces mariniharenae]
MVDARTLTFPAGFRWGAATAAFQVEGSTRADGRGHSIWDVFALTPGRILDGSNADMAADSYRRWRDDLALLAELGVDDYRFSIAWPRVQPDGTGAVNAAGLDHYARMVDGLLEAGIRPLPTLYHWDLPQPLEDAGGWLARDTAARFADYVELVLAGMGDRVGHWITLNEPNMTTLQGYALGTLAPGHVLMTDALPTAHHQLLAHGLAVRAIRAAGDAEVGIVNNHTLVVPATEDPVDGFAAAAFHAIYNRVFSDPVLAGRYPDLSVLGLERMPGLEDGDLDVISAPLDFYGVNFYNPTRVAGASADSDFAAAGLPFEPVEFDGVPVTGFGWPVVPEALTELLVTLRTDFDDALPPVVITENGASYPDVVVDGQVHDAERIAYLDRHIRAVHAAIGRGVDVRGYLVWSLIDNFEWADGYTQRFGLVHLDLETGERTRKDSFAWYRELLAAQRR